jgi:hypothetical protein
MGACLPIEALRGWVWAPAGGAATTAPAQPALSHCPWQQCPNNQNSSSSHGQTGVMARVVSSFPGPTGVVSGAGTVVARGQLLSHLVDDPRFKL